MSRIKKREEDEADKWLREHDPYYTSKKRNKGDKYPYLTPDQEVKRKRREIPISSFKSTDLDYLAIKDL